MCLKSSIFHVLCSSGKDDRINSIYQGEDAMKLFILILAVLLMIRAIIRYVKGRTPENGINESMYVDINGTKQWISIYGQKKDNPVLLYLHGGPGSATSPYDHAFTRKWSDVYTVVTWDQRNAGKSFDKVHPVTLISHDDMMEDGRQMSEFLRKHLNADKITLLGHSWGSIFGANLALAYPEYYDTYIGTGMCIDIVENEVRLYNAAKNWVGSDPKGLELLSKMDLEGDMGMEYVRARNKLMADHGYGMMKDGTDYNMFAAYLFNPYYSLADLLKYFLTVKESIDPYIGFMTHGLREFSLYGRYDYQVPYYNINGDIDYQTNYELACEYFEKVSAPYKQMFVMKDATHGLLESRSEEFSMILHEIARQQAGRN